MLCLAAIAAIIVIYFIKISLSSLKYWEKKGVKYVQPVPIFGNFYPTVSHSMSLQDLILHLYNIFPNERYIGIYQFHKPILLVRDPELIKNITIKNFENFVDHTGFFSPEIDPLWGKNLFESKGSRWRDLRQTISPVFTSSKMRAMFILMDECTKQLLHHFEQFSQEIIEVELREIFMRYTNDVIASTAFGIECNSLKNKDNEFLSIGHDLTDSSGLNGLKLLLIGKNSKLWKFLGIKMISDRVGNFFRSIIDETIKVRESKQIVRPDLIHLLMLARKGKLKYEEYLNIPDAGFATAQESELGKTTNNVNFLTNEDITAQAIVFFLAGHETTTAAICFASYELALNPHVQKKLKEEVIRASIECNGKITYEILLNIKYLDMVISETLRKWSPATILDRKCTKSFKIPPEKVGETALQINEGDTCWIPVAGLHWDPQYFPNPEIFDPERFSDENKDKIQASTYLPFGIGPRNCIGSRHALLGAKILLYNLLLHYDFVPTAKTATPIRVSPKTPFLTVENGFHVGFRRNI